MNTLHMGRAVPGTPEEQIKILGDILLKQNADVSVLPEVTQGLFGSGVLDKAPALAGGAVSAAVSSVTSAAAQLPVEGASGAHGLFNFFGLGFVGEAVKAVAGAVADVTNAAGNLLANVAGKAAEVTTKVAAVALETTVGVTGLFVGKETAEKLTETVIKAPLDILGVDSKSSIVGDEGRVKDLVSYLNKHSTDGVYQYVMKGTTATISKYALLETKANGAGGTSSILDLDKSGDVSKGDVHLDSVHLPAESYAAWLPRGLVQQGYESKLGTPITNLQAIRDLNIASERAHKMSEVIANHKKNYPDLVHIVTGDFNEPSHQDWTQATKDLYGHNGVVYPWDTTKKLTDAGYSDTFREIYPDPVKNPGMTWSSQVAGGSFKGSPADDRDRIDFTFVKSGKELDAKALSANLVGNESYYVGGKLVEKGGSQNDTILSDEMSKWPSDHKGLLVKFELSNKEGAGFIPEVQLVGTGHTSVEAA
ncbi:hypothetical protein FEM54_00740 [Pseudomonas edaphica]|uniref:Endonuclease n=1 Tax=Pseudomonas edaphica TaxID=2006980 RepID=A0ABY2UCB6_9PSED|nr:hypothetical protein [Pseudomonas edaphica]TLG94108.1 hypothetical protein FEM54_00740 [Pseudomonas edaphica]